MSTSSTLYAELENNFGFVAFFYLTSNRVSRHVPPNSYSNSIRDILLPRVVSFMYLSIHSSPESTIIKLYLDSRSSPNNKSISGLSSHIIIVFFFLSKLLWSYSNFWILSISLILFALHKFFPCSRLHMWTHSYIRFYIWSHIVSIL